MGYAINSVDRNLCTGCMACAVICPSGCISIKRDKEGFDTPNVDLSRCVGCQKCAEVCQAINPLHLHKATVAYIGAPKNPKAFVESSSGGAFASIAAEVIKEGGVVCGSTIANGGHVYHTFVDDEKKLHTLQGSKYVQSETASAYIEIQKLLSQERFVLYVGTPCQVAGLRRLLGKKDRTENLALVDILCHGVPSPLYWERHIERISRGSEPASKIKFRIKTMQSREGYCLQWNQGRKKKRINSDADTYYRNFLQGITLRECCYRCPYAGISRTGDISLGDSGFPERFDNRFSYRPQSLIIINTERGSGLFQAICKQFDLVKIDLVDEARYNQALRKPVDRGSNRGNIYEKLLDDTGMSETTTRHKVSLSKRIKRFIPWKIRQRIKKMLG